MGRYSAALARLGFDDRARDFYDVHVEADEEHQHLAAEMADALAADEPALAPTILFGAACLTALERHFAEHLLGAWNDGRSSLRAGG